MSIIEIRFLQNQPRRVKANSFFLLSPNEEEGTICPLMHTKLTGQLCWLVSPINWYYAMPWPIVLLWNHLDFMISQWKGKRFTAWQRIHVSCKQTISEDSAIKGIESSSPFFTVAGKVLTSVIDFAVVNAGALILCNASLTGQIIQDQTCAAINIRNLQDYKKVGVLG